MGHSLFYHYLDHRYLYSFVANAQVHSSTGSMITRPPHALVSRVASGRVLGSIGFRVLLCKYKRLVWPVYISRLAV